ncbi:MAG: hypothetical protein DWI22_22680 [Planctomycetota bacterium]|nr:MAG: hypothetical protein DWI22_22680 [Planctomycetota bacterium]
MPARGTATPAWGLDQPASHAVAIPV